MKKCYFLYNLICVSFMLMTYAKAYIDPSVMTYTIQVIAGLAIAAGAVFGIVVRKIKKKALKKLKIDYDSKKIVEAEVIEISVDDERSKFS